MTTPSNDGTKVLQWASNDGEFRRQVSSFRDTISDAPDAVFKPEAGRYHLYISYACPWAHRTLVVRALKGLEDIISVDIVHWHLGELGWAFKDGYKDSLYGVQHIRDIYFRANPDYQGRFTVPVLWDKKTKTIVNNESSEIIRIMNTAFDKLVPEKAGVDFYPAALKKEIDDINEWIYDKINNGVYKSGFATTQEAYERNVVPLFEALDRVEGILSKNEYLVGGQLTEADLRLWTTIVRFDSVYHGHFKCNIKSIEKDYPHILRWARRIYQLPKVAETYSLEHIKRHYYNSHLQINPTGIVPLGNVGTKPGWTVVARTFSITAPTTSGSATTTSPALPANYPTPRPFPRPGDPSVRPLVCLGIETSCDDTCAAIVTSDRQILSEVLRTQHHLHEPMGGIVPKLAHHAHMQQLPNVVREAIQAARLPNGLADIDVVAVTRGPGLAHSLGVGLNAAKSLAAALDRPLIGVHHMEAHALTARLTTMPLAMEQWKTPLEEEAAFGEAMRQRATPSPPFPFLTLLVSGGHTLLLVAHSVDRYTTLATTVDNSIGEAFDKTARELAIPWLPGRSGGPGASLEAWAKQSQRPDRFVDRLPIPMRLRDSKHEMKFSFAGLRSAVTRVAAECREVEKEQDGDAWRQDLAAAFQYCAVTHLCLKVEQGLEWCHEQGLDISSLVISGGVGRNVYLRTKMEEVCSKFEFKGQESGGAGGAKVSKAEKKKQKKAAAAAAAAEAALGEEASLVAKSPRRSVQVVCPPLKLCTDNAVMIAWTGIERYREGLFDPYDIDIIPKWPLDMLGTGKIPE
ncbi:S-glutathionyl-(chloro)hydroquinone reductase [Actinomortierella ambigua]|nr:S-glutathionyl-(chloro)hydroquinone reductase [Actinomortierella ambigua]